MTLQVQTSTHADTPEDELKILQVLRSAHDEIANLGHEVMTWVNTSTHHGTGDLTSVTDAGEQAPAEPEAAAAPATAPPAEETTPPAT